MTASEWVQARLDAHRQQRCPYCHQPCEPWWMSLFTTYTFICVGCGGLLEAFELYHDPRGALHLENHRWAVAPSSGIGAPVLWPL